MSELIVSYSRINAWRRCHKKYEYRYMQGLDRKKPDVAPLRGNILHECLDALAEKKSRIPIWEKYNKLYNKLFQGEKELYGNIIPECERIITGYKDTYENDGLTYTKGPDGRKSEIEVKAELLPGVIFRGHIDKLPKSKDGRIWVMDHKSHKSLPDEAARFGDIQTVIYYNLLPLSGGPKPDGVLWDYLRTKPPTIPEVLKNGQLTRRANIDTDYRTYMDMVRAIGANPKDYKEELERVKSNTFYQRIYLPAPDKRLLKSVQDDMIATAKEIKRMPDTARSVTYDCQRCDYFNLCQAEMRGLDSSFIRKAEFNVVDVKEIR